MVNEVLCSSNSYFDITVVTVAGATVTDDNYGSCDCGVLNNDTNADR